MGSMAARGPFCRSDEPLAVDKAEIFKSLVESNPAPRKRVGVFPVSITLHMMVLAAVFVTPLYVSDGLPEHPSYVATILYDPPPALAASLPIGRALVETKEGPKPVRENPKPEEIPTFVAPIDVPSERQPEAGARDSEQAGSETGTEHGIPEGLDGGSDHGAAGGVWEGVDGGCRGCTGIGPVERPDEPPRLLNQVKPVYSHDAFVKKIQGDVLIEAWIDTRGDVVKAKILRSVPALDAAALASIRQWRFIPARHHGEPVVTIIHATVHFGIL
jgi:protein TonB